MMELREKTILKTDKDYSIILIGFKQWFQVTLLVLVALFLLILGYWAYDNNQFYRGFAYGGFVLILYLFEGFNFLKFYIFRSHNLRIDLMDFEVYTYPNGDLSNVYIDDVEVILRFKGIVTKQGEQMKKYHGSFSEKLTISLDQEYEVTIADVVIEFPFHSDLEGVTSIVPRKIEIVQVGQNSPENSS